jgi:hypothetical protein
VVNGSCVGGQAVMRRLTVCLFVEPARCNGYLRRTSSTY